MTKQLSHSALREYEQMLKDEGRHDGKRGMDPRLVIGSLVSSLEDFTDPEGAAEVAAAITLIMEKCPTLAWEVGLNLYFSDLKRGAN